MNSKLATVLSTAIVVAFAATLGAANWPSKTGTTAPGVVIEDGAGNKIGVTGSPLVTTGGGGGSGCLVSGATGIVYNTGSSLCGTNTHITTTGTGGLTFTDPNITALGTATAGFDSAMPGISFGYGGATGQYGLALTPNSTKSGQATLELDSFGTNLPSILEFLSARGSNGAMTATQSGDSIGQEFFVGAISSAALNKSIQITASALENWSSGHAGAKYVIGTVTTGSAGSPGPRLEVGYNANGDSHVIGNLLIDNNLQTAGIGVGIAPTGNRVKIQENGAEQIDLYNSGGALKGLIGTIGAFGAASTDDLRIRSDAASIFFGFSGTVTAQLGSDFGWSLYGSTSGSTKLLATAAASGTLTFPARTATVATTTGATTTNNCAKFDASGNVVDNGSACGSGGSVSITAATPNLVVTPSPLTGTGTIGTTNVQNAPADGGSHSYTFVSGDATKEVVLVSSFTAAAMPQATGSFAAGFSLTSVNQGAITATSTTSTVNGIAGATGIKLGANQFTQWDAYGGNWLVGLGLPQPTTQTTTTILRDDMTWGVAPLAAIGTGAASHAVPVDVAGTSTYKVIPDCIDSGGNHINYTQSTDAFSCGTSSGAAGGGGMFQYSDNGLTLTAATRYVPIGGSGTPSTTEADFATKSSSAATINNLQVNLSADPGSGQTLVVTLRKNNGDTTLTCTITGPLTPPAAVCQDLTHSISIAQNDLINWKVVTTGTFIATPSMTILANSGTTNNGVTGSAVNGNIVQGTGSASVGDSGIAAAQVAQLNVNQAWTKGQAVTPDTATQCGTQSAAGTMTPNFALSNSCVATFGAGNLTIANPTNVKAGQSWVLSLTQDGTGSRTVTWGSQYKWAGGTAPTLSTAANAVDILSCFASDTTHINCTLAVKGAS